jgi:hypothetical protein
MFVLCSTRLTTTRASATAGTGRGREPIASDHLGIDLARLRGAIAAPFRRERRLTLVVRSAGPPGDGELVVTREELRLAVRAIERRATGPVANGSEAELLRAALEATADRLVPVAAQFERLGLDAAAATVRVVEREARDELRKLRVDRDEGRED